MCNESEVLESICQSAWAQGAAAWHSTDLLQVHHSGYPHAGFYIVTYALAIYNLNLVLGFITPAVDPELEAPVLPSKNEEYRPFRRRLQEMKFWCATHRSQIGKATAA